jgi:hypothetical protein
LRFALSPLDGIIPLVVGCNEQWAMSNVNKEFHYDSKINLPQYQHLSAFVGSIMPLVRWLREREE